MNFSYSPVLSVTGLSSSKVDLNSRVPWVYLIFSHKHKVIYIGETYDENGVVRRLSDHFGGYVNSTLKQAVSKYLGIRNLKPPFTVYGAVLPGEEDQFPYESSAKQVRLRFEADLHELVATRFLPEHPGWNIVSSAIQPNVSSNENITAVVTSIFDNVMSSFNFNKSLTKASPWNFVVLDIARSEAVDDKDLGVIIEEIELSLFNMIITSLKEHFALTWWTEGVPKEVRMKCVTRREEEGANELTPAEAYMDFMAMRETVKRNWNLFGEIMTVVSMEDGKDKATRWIVEINELRKVWAHPIKQQFNPIANERIHWLRQCHAKFIAALNVKEITVKP